MARSADDEVPEHVWRLTMYYHDLLHIKWGYYEVGGVCPEHIITEINRVHERLEHIITEETNQGGTFHKIKKEMESANETRSRSSGRG